MIVWIIPGWAGAHEKVPTEIAPTDVIAQNLEAISKVWNEAKNDIQLEQGNEYLFDLPGEDGYQIVIKKIEKYSPTFPEYFKLVKRSMYDVMLTLKKCYVHGGPEVAARIFEMGSRTGAEFLDNEEIYDTFVKKILQPDAPSNSVEALGERVLLGTYWETGLRLDEITEMKIGDVDLRSGRVKSHS